MTQSGFMKTNSWIIIVYSLLLSFLSPLSSWSEQTDYFSPRNLKKFADNLYQNQDYYRAIGEYQRLLAFTSKAQDSIIYRIANCYEKQGAWNKATLYYKKVIKCTGSRLTEYSYYQIALNLFFQKHYQQSIRFLEQNADQIQHSVLFQEFDYLKGINFIYLDQWNRAYSYFNERTRKYNNQKFAQATKFASGKSELSFKKPWLAGVMSTIIPGSGKLYTLHRGDAFYSMMLLSLIGYLAYDGIQNKKSTKGWLFGSMFTGFYLGNIYGSIISAKVYNEKQIQFYLQNSNFQLKIYNEIPF